MLEFRGWGGDFASRSRVLNFLSSTCRTDLAGEERKSAAGQNNY